MELSVNTNVCEASSEVETKENERYIQKVFKTFKFFKSFNAIVVQLSIHLGNLLPFTGKKSLIQFLHQPS